MNDQIGCNEKYQVDSFFSLNNYELLKLFRALNTHVGLIKYNKSKKELMLCLLIIRRLLRNQYPLSSRTPHNRKDPL